MELDTNGLNQLADLAERAALAAGELIRSRRGGAVEVMTKTGGDSLASQVVTEVDGAAQQAILETLHPSFEKYDLALLTEESEDDGSRLKKDYFWCIDPLDGTLPFTRGIPGFGVSVALVRRDGVPVVGVTLDPTEGIRFRSVLGGGIRRNGVPWSRPIPDQNEGRCLHFYCDCTFRDVPNQEEQRAEMHELALKAGYADSEVRIGGGAVLNACALLQHPPAIYIKKPKPQLGCGCFWDFAATACLFNEAGAHVSDFDGNPLQLNSTESLFMNKLGVCYATNTRLAQAITEIAR